MPCVRWTAEQDRKLLKLADEGVSESRIAIKLGRSLNGIRIRFERLVGRRSMSNEKNVPNDARPISQRLAKRALEKLDAHPPQEKTKAVKTEKKDAPPSAFAKWTPEDDNMLKSMSRRGDPVKSMAKALGRTERALYFRLTQLSEQRVVATEEHKHRLKTYSSEDHSTKRSSSSASERAQTGSGGSPKCAICHERSICCALVPCGHTFCVECTKCFRLCPNCRSAFTTVMKIFITS